MGTRIARLLKSQPQFHHTVILMLTGRDGIIDRLKGWWAGAQIYLTKPVTTQALISAVKVHLGVPIPAETETKTAQMQGRVCMDRRLRSAREGSHGTRVTSVDGEARWMDGAITVIIRAGRWLRCSYVSRERKIRLLHLALVKRRKVTGKGKYR